MHSVLFLMLAFVASAAITAFIIPRILLISFKKRLFDTVDQRKIHSGIIPRLGGVAFSPAIVMSMALLTGIHTIQSGGLATASQIAPRLALSLCALMLLYMEGITDDLIGVGYRAKFACQFFCASMVVASGVWLNNLYGLLGIYALPCYVGIPLSILLIVYIINAINLIDGIDGLASGLSMVALFFLGALFFSCGDTVYAAIAFATLGTLVPFFIYNVFGRADRGKKIFMGDCGSQTIGLLLGLLAIRFSMYDEQTESALPHSLVIAFSMLMIPCLDVIRVMLGRLRRGCNPFLPDKSHIHHKFLALGMSHRTTMVVILTLDAFFVMLNFGLLHRLNVNLLLLIDVAAWCIGHVWISRLIRKRQLMENSTAR